MIIDFNSNKLFGNSTHDIINPMRREFTSTDRKAVQKYINNRFSYLHDHNFAERLQTLNNNWDPELAKALDRDHQQACDHAAKKAKRKPNIAFIQKLASLRAQKRVLCKVILSHRLRKDFDIQIARSMLDTDGFLIPDNMAKCKDKLKEVQTRIREMEKDPDSTRILNLAEKMEEALSKGDKQRAKVIKFKMKAEATKKMFTKIRMYKGNKKSSITSIKIPTNLKETASDNCTL